MQPELKNVKQIQRGHYGFAALLDDGSVVAWGHPAYGGSISAVQHQLRNVQQISASLCAFAAVLSDGSVVTWGSATYGGDIEAARDLQGTGKGRKPFLEGS